MAYNRVIKDLNGLSPGDFLALLAESFLIEETTEKAPRRRGEFLMYVDGTWYRLVFRQPIDRQSDTVARLDVSILQKICFRVHFGNNRSADRRANRFVGGKRGAEELEKMVDTGDAKLAFSMYQPQWTTC